MQPASAATSSASGNGKNASVARTAPFERSPALRAAIHDESTRDICPAPIPTVAASFTKTIVFDFTRHEIVHAISRSAHSRSVGWRRETTFQSLAALRDHIAILDQRTSRKRADVER